MGDMPSIDRCQSDAGLADGPYPCDLPAGHEDPHVNLADDLAWHDLGPDELETMVDMAGGWPDDPEGE